jgi:hypothetical protein
LVEEYNEGCAPLGPHENSGLCNTVGTTAMPCVVWKDYADIVYWFGGFGEGATIPYTLSCTVDMYLSTLFKKYSTICDSHFLYYSYTRVLYIVYCSSPDTVVTFTVIFYINVDVVVYFEC